MSELVALNGLKSRHRIRVGQKLRLPTDADPAPTRKAAYQPKPAKAAAKSPPAKAAPPASGTYTVRRGDNLTRIAERFDMSVGDLVALNDLPSRHRIAAGQTLRVVQRGPSGAKTHPDATAALSPARSAPLEPSPADLAALEGASEEATPESDASPIEPSPGLLADPSDYTVASNGTILVQTGETLGHYAEWLGLRASRLRKINGLRFGEPLSVQQRIRLDFSNTRPEDFERIRVEFHRTLQEEFFAEWEIEGTVVHRVGPGDSLWVLSTRRFDVPIWLLRQYNPDVDLESLSAGTQLTIPKLRQRNVGTSRLESVTARSAAAG
jgi:membrane-bound lytic murein transglycosylase D